MNGIIQISDVNRVDRRKRYFFTVFSFRLVWLGFRRPLVSKDLWCLRSSLWSTNIGTKFHKHWEREKERVARLVSDMKTYYIHCQLAYKKTAYKRHAPIQHVKNITHNLCRTFFGNILYLLLFTITICMLHK